jgi:beta-lactamase class A
LKRRRLIKGALLGAGLLCLPRARGTRLAATEIDQQLAQLERRYGGRLGVTIVHTTTHRRHGYRNSERFLMCSTFKALAAAAILARVDKGTETLRRRIPITPDTMLSYPPVTSTHVGDTMTVAGLCEAAITLSDNTAANLLLASMQGPAAVTAFARGIGDHVTRLDRIEPALNVGSPGDLRDTTTPDAMADTLRTIVLGDVLSPTSKALLTQWLRATTTGDKKLRAGLPGGWQAGDKTGTGPHGESNDIAVLWPPHDAPRVVAAFYVNPNIDEAARSAVIAQVGRLASAG